jgi:hypothetical protein
MPRLHLPGSAFAATTQWIDGFLSSERSSAPQSCCRGSGTCLGAFSQTQPLRSISRDCTFFLFTSDRDAQLGTGPYGPPRSDVFIVKLD